MGTSKPPAATPAAASPPPAVPGGKGGSPAPSTVASLPGAWVTVSSLHASDGSLITVAAFHGLAQFALHDGSKSPGPLPGDRKSTRLNSSHANISYAVFCLKKKTNTNSAIHKTQRSVNVEMITL